MRGLAPLRQREKLQETREKSISAAVCPLNRGISPGMCPFVSAVNCASSHLGHVTFPRLGGTNPSSTRKTRDGWGLGLGAVQPGDMLLHVHVCSTRVYTCIGHALLGHAAHEVSAWLHVMCLRHVRLSCEHPKQAHPSHEHPRLVHLNHAHLNHAHLRHAHLSFPPLGHTHHGPN